VITFEIRERYLQQDIQTQLGSIAADLARIVSFADFHDDKAVTGLIEESRAFVEWGTPSLLPDRVEDAARLVDIQRGLTHWYWIWNQVQTDPNQRQKLREQAQRWSDEVLKMSGLLEQE